MSTDFTFNIKKNYKDGVSIQPVLNPRVDSGSTFSLTAEIEGLTTSERALTEERRPKFIGLMTSSATQLQQW